MKKIVSTSLFILSLFSPYDSRAKSSVRPPIGNCCSIPCCPKEKEKIEYDYIIVGGGTAGLVLARELSNKQDGKYKNSVLVLEWGENRIDDPVVLSTDFFAAFGDLTYSQKYNLVNLIPLNFGALGVANQFVYTDGRTWGGSSAHNYFLAVRGTPPVYNQWAALSGNNIWSYNNLLPIMKALENYTPDGTIANPAQRGFGGPLSITQLTPVDSDPFAIGLAAGTSAPLISDYNDPSLGNVGVSADQRWITPGSNSVRSFSADFIRSVVDENGNGLDGRKLKIESNALVSRVIFDCKKAVGVKYLFNGKKEATRKRYAKKEIILCAGANSSPAILQRSGIGDKALLESLGINVVYDNPNVGQHLNSHYGAGALIAASSTLPMEAFVDMFPFMPNDGVRRFQIIPLGVGPDATFTFGTLTTQKSEGSLKIVSKDPTIYPALDLNLYSDGSVTTPGTDAYLVVSYFKILKLVAAALGTVVIQPAPELYPAPFGPAPDDSLLLNYAQQLSNTVIANHNVGTTRMGISAADNVVDGNLRVFGVKNLMVADIGISPIIEDGNTSYSAYVIGAVAAKILGVPVPPLP